MFGYLLLTYFQFLNDYLDKESRQIKNSSYAIFFPHLYPSASLAMGSVPSAKTSYQSAFPFLCAIHC